MKKDAEESLNKANFTEGEHSGENKPLLAAATATLKVCYYCGRENHEKSKCPAKQSNCRKCGKLGHWATLCRSKQKAIGLESMVSAAIHKPLCAIPGGLVSASKSVKIDGKRFDGLVDSCSTESYINSKVVQKLSLSVYPCESNVCMARTDIKAKTMGFCIINMEVEGRLYESFRLNVVKQLCGDIVLGTDFQALHKRLIFEFNGDLPEFTVSNAKNCALVSAVTDKTVLFPNISSDYKPISTKSRRFNKSDSEFINATIKEWLEEGIIEPSYYV